MMTSRKKKKKKKKDLVVVEEGFGNGRRKEEEEEEEDTMATTKWNMCLNYYVQIDTGYIKCYMNFFIYLVNSIKLNLN